MTTALAITEIRINGRHRRDLGDVAALADSIKHVGLLHPVVVTKDRLLVAGERRIAAAKALGWTDIPVTVAETLTDAITLLNAERDENTCRKDFAPSEAVSVGKALEELERPKAKERQAEQARRNQPQSKSKGGNLPPLEKSKTRDRVAATVGMSSRTYEKAKAVIDAAEGEPEKFAPLAKEMDRTGNVDKAFRRLNVKKINERPAPPIPADLYNVVLADPPWQYDFAEKDNRHLDNQYPTQSLDAICAKIPPSADDAVLFLWATAPKLLEALAVMKAWGFEYRTNAVWDKEKIGMGYWFRGQHELLLVGVKGKFSPPQEDRRASSVIRSPRGAHSQKPACAHQIIERMFPKAQRLEMFARDQRDGWNVWGNQA